VPDSKTLKLLLVEDDLEDEQLLAEAFLEIEENRQWCNWRSASVLHVEQLEEALDCLRAESFDVILLNLSLPDSPALLDSFHEVQAVAGDAPIIVLADEDDENLANLLLREGAQDVVLKKELECAPLARSLRYAVERQRRITTLYSPSGPLTRQGFVAIATHYIELAHLSRTPLLMASLEITNGIYKDREAREMSLLGSAELLRAAFEPPTLIGRLGPARFGLITAGLTETTMEALLNRTALAMEEAARRDGHPVTVRFSVAEIDRQTRLEEILGHNGDEFAEHTHRRAKTVMLAD